ncbi:unnamed protein product [Closterium sp. Yama58-4]|nr:unnamed protein product [Closterium sp. Yama58-4]
MTHAIECGQWGAAKEAERVKMVSCTGPCHKKLPFCSHMCVEMCHPGPCPKPTQCRKKRGARRRRRKTAADDDDDSSSSLFGFIPPAVRRWALIITLLFFLSLLLLAAGVGLKALNDWMNERDRLRPRKSFRY